MNEERNKLEILIENHAESFPMGNHCKNYRLQNKANAKRWRLRDFSIPLWNFARGMIF